jgi:L-fuculose-phosphate aldolase
MSAHVSVLDRFATEDLTDRQALAVLHRMLWREGYDDHIAGHITLRVGDDRLLATPHGLLWDEVRASDIITIDREGLFVDGRWPVPSAIQLHVALHQERPETVIAVHHHPRYALVWSAAHRLPPVYDQLGCFEHDDLVLYDEYESGVSDLEIARRNVLAIRGSQQALLANHGVLVLGKSVRDVHQRCLVLEHRCRLAWHVEALGGGIPVAAANVSAIADRVEEKGGWTFLFEAMINREIRRDPTVLE